MSELASDRLLQLVQPYSTGIGIGAEDIGRIPRTEELYSTLLACLRSSQKGELVWGLFFCEGLLRFEIPEQILVELKERLPLLVKHQEHAVRDAALPVFIALRERFSDYRITMLHCLRDTSCEVRTRALGAYETFLTREDIPLLLDFQNDDFMCETEMGSPLVYPIRNQALAIIEALCQQQFTKTEEVKMVEGGQSVYWWEWKPFLDWWNKRQSKWRFWQRK